MTDTPEELVRIVRGRLRDGRTISDGYASDMADAIETLARRVAAADKLAAVALEVERQMDAHNVLTDAVSRRLYDARDAYLGNPNTAGADAMTDTPITDAERLAQTLEDHARLTNATGGYPLDRPTMTGQAAALLRAQAAEIERLREVIRILTDPDAGETDRRLALKDARALKEKTDG